MKENPFLDRNEDVEIHTSGKLPHWHQDGKIQFVTFRLADSLPQTRLLELKDLADRFEKIHPKPWNNDTSIECQKTIGSKYEQYLNNGYGSCCLKSEICQKVVADAIMYYDNIKYETIAFVVMPNHVHILIQLVGDCKLEGIIQSIKRHTTREINTLLNRHGPLWMKGYFDRIVRSEDNLKHYLNYIKNNPKHLQNSEYYLYI